MACFSAAWVRMASSSEAATDNKLFSEIRAREVVFFGIFSGFGKMWSHESCQMYLLSRRDIPQRILSETYGSFLRHVNLFLLRANTIRKYCSS